MKLHHEASGTDIDIPDEVAIAGLLAQMGRLEHLVDKLRDAMQAIAEHVIREDDSDRPDYEEAFNGCQNLARTAVEMYRLPIHDETSREDRHA